MSELEARAETMPYSMLDRASLPQIKADRIVKLDIRSGVIPLASVGLDPSGLGAVIGDPSGPEILLVMDGPSRRESVMTRTVMASTEERTESVGMVTFWQVADSGAAAFALLRDGIARWGFPEHRIERWIANIEAEPDPDGKYSLSAGVGPAGLICQVLLDYKRDGRSVLTYDIYTSPDYRIPENIDAIKRTGKMDLTAVTQKQAETARRNAGRP